MMSLLLLLLLSSVLAALLGGIPFCCCASRRCAFCVMCMCECVFVHAFQQLTLSHHYKHPPPINETGFRKRCLFSCFFFCYSFVVVVVVVVITLVVQTIFHSLWPARPLSPPALPLTLSLSHTPLWNPPESNSLAPKKTFEPKIRPLPGSNSTHKQHTYLDMSTVNILRTAWNNTALGNSHFSSHFGRATRHPTRNFGPKQRRDSK